MVSTSELTGAGISMRQIEHRVSTGLLVPIHYGAYKLGDAALDDLGRWRGAAVAVGKDAVVCLNTAGALWEVQEERSTWVHVAIPPRVREGDARSGIRRRKGIWIHRPRRLSELAVTEHRGVPTTTLLRVAFDLAPLLRPREFQTVLNNANAEHGLSLKHLVAALDAEVECRARNAGAMRRTLEVHAPGSARLRSVLEQRLKVICSDYALPPPVSNAKVGRFEADFQWPGFRLIVETDGGTHEFPWQRERDVARDEHHRDIGYVVVRVSYVQATYEPAATARRIATELIDQGWAPPPGWAMP